MKPGPLVTISLDCGACSYEQAVDDVVYCTAPTIVASTGPREIGVANWNTPKWCPLRAAAIAEAVERLGAK